MKNNNLSQLIRGVFRRLFLFVLAGLAVPAAWGIVSWGYRIQQGWTDVRFVTCYLLLFVMLYLLTLLVGTRPALRLPVTVWSAVVLAGIGLGRVMWMLVQWEYATGVEIPLRSTLLILVLGLTSLGLTLRWSNRRKSASASKQRPAAQTTVISQRLVPVSAPRNYDDAWW